MDKCRPHYARVERRLNPQEFTKDSQCALCRELVVVAVSPIGDRPLIGMCGGSGFLDSGIS